MIAGSLQVKNGYYYMVLYFPAKDDRKKPTKWISTGLKVKGNKKRAEEMLINARREYDPEETYRFNPNQSRRQGSAAHEAKICCQFFEC